MSSGPIYCKMYDISSRDGDHEIYIMRKDGTALTRLTFNPFDDWQPRWGNLAEGENILHIPDSNLIK